MGLQHAAVRRYVTCERHVSRVAIADSLVSVSLVLALDVAVCTLPDRLDRNLQDRFKDCGLNVIDMHMAHIRTPKADYFLHNTDPQSHSSA